MVETADGVKTHSRKCSNTTCDTPDVEKCVPDGDDTVCICYDCSIFFIIVIYYNHHL